VDKVLTAGLVVVALSSTVCAHRGFAASASPGTPPSASQPWTPPQPLPAAVVAPAPMSADEAAIAGAARAAAASGAPAGPITIGGHELPNGKLDLPLAIELALANSPRTQSTWMAARAAAAEVGSKRSEWYPDVALEADLVRQHTTANTAGGLVTLQQTTINPVLNLSYLLLDFGGRAADVAEARDLLLAANLTHNQAVQDVVLDVSQAFYRYVSARALRDAAKADVDTAQTNLEAANRRHDAGLATVADVLQAKTALAQAQLTLQQDEGQMEVIRGTLATAMGLPADLPVDAAPLDENVPVESAAETIERELARALSERPELLAARARAIAAEQRIRQERSAGLPSLGFAASGGRLDFQAPSAGSSDTYTASLLLHVPLFSGFEHHYNVEKARAEAAEAHADADTLENQVRLQVFTSYYDLQTAALRFHTAGELLGAAEENERVASGRYHEGVGSILDLLQAQSALANARAQRILARADWLLSLSQLAHDTGALRQAGAAPPTNPAPAANTTPPTPR